MCGTGNHDDPWLAVELLLRGLPHERHEESGEEEVAEVVGPDLHLEAVFRPGLQRTHHHPGVQDQQV